MSRKKLALVLAVPTLLVVLAVGLTRGTNDDAEDDGGTTPTTEAVSDLSTGEPYLQPTDESIPVPEASDCRSATSDSSPSCEAVQIDALEVAWLVEQDGEAAAIASFLRRTSPTEWQRTLRANGTNIDRPFERVNVRFDDLTADGAVETIFGFHHESNLAVDVVDSNGVVLLHLDLGDGGQVLVGGGQLITFEREGDAWRRDEIAIVDGALGVRLSEQFEGPPQGNL